MCWWERCGAYWLTGASVLGSEPGTHAIDRHTHFLGGVLTGNHETWIRSAPTRSRSSFPPQPNISRTVDNVSAVWREQRAFSPSQPNCVRRCSRTSQAPRPPTAPHIGPDSSILYRHAAAAAFIAPAFIVDDRFSAAVQCLSLDHWTHIRH